MAQTPEMPENTKFFQLIRSVPIAEANAIMVTMIKTAYANKGGNRGVAWSKSGMNLGSRSNDEITSMTFLARHDKILNVFVQETLGDV